jgi:hypothetical protein
MLIVLHVKQGIIQWQGWEEEGLTGRGWMKGGDGGGGGARVDLILNMKLGHERLFSTLYRQIYYFIL